MVLWSLLQNESPALDFNSSKVTHLGVRLRVHKSVKNSWTVEGPRELCPSFKKLLVLQVGKTQKSSDLSVST